MSDRFTVFGQTVPRIAIINGILLSFWGLASYIISDMSSITAMIPTFMGVPMLILGLLSQRDENKSHRYMHACMVIALIMTLSPPLMFAGMGIPDSSLTLASNLVLFLVGVIFMICGIMSFRHARLLREAGN